MSVGAEGTYDAVLQDRETNPKVELGLVLDYGEDNDGNLSKRWTESRAAPIPARRSQGALNWTQKDPISDLVFAQDDWSLGAFRPYYRDGDRRYAKSDGVDLRHEGVAALGPKRGTPRGSVPNKGGIRSNFLLANGDFEEGLTSGWSAGSGSTLAVNTSVVRTGNYSLQVTVAQSTAAGAIASQSLANPTVYAARTITFFAYVRRASGSDSGVFLRVYDGVGTTNSSAVTADAWTYVSVAHVVDGSPTELTVSIQHNATTSTGIHVFRVDDVTPYPAGGTECVGFGIRSSADPDEIYAAVGRMIVYWEETTFRWDAAYISDIAAATDIEEFDDTIFVAYGNSSTGRQYVAGSSTTWTDAAISSTSNHQDNFAVYFTKARNAYGNWALWKSGPSTAGGTEVNAIAWSTNPADNSSGSWSPSSYFTVGSTSRAITGLHSFGDSFVATKVDGVWVWDVTVNDFTNLTQEWEHSTDAENGKRGQYFLGALYLSSIRQGFQRLDGASLIDVSDTLMAPRLTDFGGRVTAMTASARELIIGLDQPTADTAMNKTSRLARFTIVDGVARLHVLQEPAIGRIDALSLHRSTRLWAFGRSYDSNLGAYFLSSSLWFEPEKIAAPYADASPLIESSGFFETSIWHGGAPETDKALIALTIWCEDLDTEHTIQVDFGREGRAASTTRLGTFRTSDRIQTLFFKNIENPLDNAVCRFAQLRFTFSTDDTVSPKMYAFALHTQLAPEPIKVWDLYAIIGDKTLMRTGVPLVENKASIRARFDELERQIFPITLVEDFGQAHDGESEDGANTYQVRLVTYARQPRTSDEYGEELWFLRLQEVPISG